MIQLNGDRLLPLPAAEVWTKLTDGRFLARCLPDLETLVQADENGLVAVLKPGFSFVRGTLELTLRIVEKLAGQSARLQLHTKGIGNHSDVEASWTLVPEGAGCRLAWQVAVTQLGGLMKMVPPGLLKAAAQKVINDIWGEVEKKLTAEGTA